MCVHTRTAKVDKKNGKRKTENGKLLIFLQKRLSEPFALTTFGYFLQPAYLMKISPEAGFISVETGSNTSFEMLILCFNGRVCESKPSERR